MLRPALFLGVLLLRLPAAAQVQAPVRVQVPVIGVAVPFVPPITAIQAAQALPLSSVATVPSIPAPAALPLAGAVARSVRPAGAMPRPWRLVITGPPGSGKGTYATMISRDYGPVPISAGELLRAYAVGDPAIAETMKEGRLVPSELVVGLIRDRLSQEDVRRRGFILDGFPRRIEEAQQLEGILRELGMPLDAVIFLGVPEPELLRRILSRGRADDNAQTFHERMRVYENETKPVFGWLARQAPFLEPSVASGDPATAYAQVRLALEGLSRN